MELGLPFTYIADKVYVNDTVGIRLNCTFYIVTSILSRRNIQLLSSRTSQGVSLIFTRHVYSYTRRYPGEVTPVIISFQEINAYLSIY